MSIMYVTKETLEQMKVELQHLKSVERPAASRAIAEAREKGDLKENAEYDAYFEQLKRLPDGPERTRVLHNMYRIMEVNGVLGLSSTGIATRISHSRVEGYRKHPLILGDWIYYDIQKP